MFTYLLPVSQSISLFLVHISGFALDYWFCVLICAWGERVVFWLTTTDSWSPVERVICILQETCERGDRSIITKASSGCSVKWRIHFVDQYQSNLPSWFQMAELGQNTTFDLAKCRPKMMACYCWMLRLWGCKRNETILVSVFSTPNHFPR